MNESMINSSENIKNKILLISEKLNLKKNKYPNLTKAWSNAINYKLNKIIKMLDKCDNFCNNVENEIPNDLSPQTIALLYILNNNYLKN